MQHKNGSHRNGPHGPARRVSDRLGCLEAADKVTDEGTHHRDDERVRRKHKEPTVASFELQIERISKQVSYIAFVMYGSIEVSVSANDPAHVTPQKIHQWRVWIGLVVAVLVMHAMDRDPAGGAILQIAHAHDCERVLQPFGTGEPTVRKQTVVTDRDAEHSKHEVAKNREDESRPREQIGERRGQERYQRDQVDCGEHDHVLPKNLHRLSRFGSRQSLGINPVLRKTGHRITRVQSDGIRDVVRLVQGRVCHRAHHSCREGRCPDSLGGECLGTR